MDNNIKKHLYIQLTAGRGPIECAAVVGKITEEIKDYLYNAIDTTDNSIKYNIIDYNEHYESDKYNRYDCFMSVTFDVSYTVDFLPEIIKNEWEGTIKYVATKNPFRPNHKRKNWYIGVSIYEIPVPITINEKDIHYETLRSSGHGGQNVNKVESAVRATYLPTGVSVVAQDTRDQPRNRQLAKQRLIDKLSLINKYNEDVLKTDNWSEHNNLSRGNEKKTFKGEL